MRTSHSALDTFKQCPQKYKFQEIDRKKAPKSKEALFGTAVHSVLNYMFSRNPIFPTLEEILAQFRSLIVQSKIPDTEKERYKALGERVLKNFYVKNPPWNFNTIDLESRFEVALDDPQTGRNHVLVGKIDRIDKLSDDNYEIIDYKTSSKLPSQESVDTNAQLSIYQLGLMKRWPHLNPDNITLSLYFLRAEEKLSTKRTAEKLHATETNILHDLRTIEKKIVDNDFPPTPSALCNWCGYRPICPAWRHLYDKEKTPLAEKIATDDLVHTYISIKKEITEREEKLKELGAQIYEYLNEKGIERIFGDSMVIARKIQERTSIDIDKIQDVLMKAGVWEHVLAPDEKRLKKLLPTLSDDLQEQIKTAIVVKRFSVLSVAKKPHLENDAPPVVP